MQVFTFFSHPDFNRRLWNFTKSAKKARGLYRRWGITPRPEDYVNIILPKTVFVNNNMIIIPYYF